MNITLLLSRLLTIRYAGFFLLFAFGEGISQKSAFHLPAPLLEKSGWSAVFFGLLFATSSWFYQAWKDIRLFTVVCLPLAVILVLNLIALIKK